MTPSIFGKDVEHKCTGLVVGGKTRMILSDHSIPGLPDSFSIETVNCDTIDLAI